ncbi:EF-hand domain pair [Phytophthora cactorum]|nr:EF-hand domain pair [Phytophthora cactorum]
MRKVLQMILNLTVLRYDVLLKLAFGSPDLNDETFFEKCVRKKLFREKERLQSLFKEITTQGSSHKLTLQDFHDTFIVQAEEHPLTRVEVKCWRNAKYHGMIPLQPLKLLRRVTLNRLRNSSLSAAKGTIYSVYLTVLVANSGLDISQCYKELGKMLHEMGTVGVDHIDLNNLVQTISQSTIGDIPKTSSRDTIHCDAFFDALFDWNAVVTSMRLPDSLVEVKRVFEKFDWDQNGTIRSEDWNKAYRLICSGNHEMAEWEVRVLQRKFTGQRAREETIDYARLIQQFASTMSTAKIERLFHALDTDSKGYFNAADLKTYLTKEFARESEKDEDSSSVLLNSADAVASVMHLLAGDRSVLRTTALGHKLLSLSSDFAKFRFVQRWKTQISDAFTF